MDSCWKEDAITSLSFGKGFVYTVQLDVDFWIPLSFYVNRTDEMQGNHLSGSKGSPYCSATTALLCLIKILQLWVTAWLIANRKLAWGESAHFVVSVVAVFEDWSMRFKVPVLWSLAFASFNFQNKSSEAPEMGEGAGCMLRKHRSNCTKAIISTSLKDLW